MRRFVPTAAAGVLALAAALAAGPARALPDQIMQEGLVTDNDGRPVEGEHLLRVRIYDAARGGEVLFDEQHPAVPFLGGYYAIAIGAEEPLDGAIFRREGLWLGISIDRGDELEPRTPLRKVPASFVADVAMDAVGDIHPSTVSIGERLVIDADGRWVGDPVGLQGPAGPAGAIGPVGPRGPAGAAGGDGSADTPEQVRDKLRQVDGAGSGVDADQLDGIDSTDFVRTARQVLDRLRTVDGEGSGVDADRLDGLDSTQFVRTAEQILERLRTVDGDGSGLDADRLDGIDSTQFVRTAEQVRDLLRTVDGAGSGVDADRLDGRDSSQFVTTGEQILALLRPVDGAGSGLDADRLDGLDSTQFLRADRSGILAGDLDVRGLLSVQRADQAPAACGADLAGAVFFDQVEGRFLGCDGDEWIPLSGGGGGGGGDNGDLGEGRNSPGANCQDVARQRPDAQNGVYWIDPDGPGRGEPFQVFCDLEAGGWALLYATYSNQAGRDTWALTWDQVVNRGLAADNPQEGRNYLLPVGRWTELDQIRLTSAGSGSILLDNVSLRADDLYRLNFTPTGNGRMDYHRDRPLSTVDRDNDVWGDHCSEYARSFGWYGSCCNLCMTTGQGGWPGGSNPYHPTDWNYTQTDWMVWWGRYATRDEPLNGPEDAALDCEAIRQADPDAADGVYWNDLDGDGGDPPMPALCDISGGGWTQIYATYEQHSARQEWALSWNTVLEVGKSARDPQPGQNYLMPVSHWTGLRQVELRSGRSGSILLDDFSINAASNYTMNFSQTGNGRMDYHRGRPLSTVDRDNDVWEDHCSGYAQSFGWYGSCCNLCMTTGEGGWPGGSAPYNPTDWNYTATPWMSWWGKFERPLQTLNSRDEAAADCRAILQADGDARSGIYWVTLGSRDRFRVECDMETDGGGWTRVYSTYEGEAAAGAWALTWDTVVNLGLRHNAPPSRGNYLLPLRYWNHFGRVRLTSATSGSILLDDFSLDQNNSYRLDFQATGNGRMDYHRGRNLSTVDRDNDVWGDHCSGYAQSFGWYGSCCNLCMTTGQGGWPGGSNPYHPTDWNYVQTPWMVWWAR